MTSESSCGTWREAAAFAARAHQHQFRKDGQTPYIVHPFRVAMIVRHVFAVDDPTAIMAALLHDTIEDTTTDYDDLVAAFGQAVADAVAALTKDGRLPESEREAAYDRGLTAASWQARLVKLADVYDNFCDAADDQKRAKVAEKARRAIVCAGSDERLQNAVAAVRALIAQPLAAARG